MQYAHASVLLNVVTPQLFQIAVGASCQMGQQAISCSGCNDAKCPAECIE